MIIKPIRNDDELKAAFQRLEMVFQAEPDTSEANEIYVEGNNSTSVDDLCNEMNHYTEIVRTQISKHDERPIIQVIHRTKVNL